MQIEVFLSKFSFLLGVKTIRHQSFAILSPVFVPKHAMILVNFDNFDNLIKIAAENSYSVLPFIIRTIPHTSSFTNVTKIHKTFLKNSKPHGQTTS